MINEGRGMKQKERRERREQGRGKRRRKIGTKEGKRNERMINKGRGRGESEEPWRKGRKKKGKERK